MKKKLIYKALGLFLSAAILVTSVPVTAQAEQNGPDGVEAASVSDNTLSEETLNPGETEEMETAPEESTASEGINEEYLESGDIFAFEWKEASDEEINTVLKKTDWTDMGDWLYSMSEKDRAEILARDTILNDNIKVYNLVLDEDSENTTETSLSYKESAKTETILYKYALSQRTTTVKATASTRKFKYNQGSYSVVCRFPSQSFTYTVRLSGIDTTKVISDQQKKLTLTINGATWEGLSMTDDSSVDLRLDMGVASTPGATPYYVYLYTNWSLVKPAGYNVTLSSRAESNAFYIYLKSKDATTYEFDVNTNKGTPWYGDAGEFNASSYRLVQRVNIIRDMGVSDTNNATTTNAEHVLTFTPASYTVNYNGNGATAGGVGSQSCVYDGVYTTQGNGFSRAFTVTYNGNGGTPAVASQTATSTFLGWGANRANGADYAAGQSFANLTTVNQATITMYAIWSPGAVTLPNATRTGYMFAGWDIGAPGTPVVPDRDITATAGWVPVTYNITLDPNNGAEKQKITTTYDQNVQLPTPSKAGYTFNGWVGEGGTFKGVVKNLTAVNNGSINLTAAWTANTDTPYTVKRWKEKSEGSDDYIPFDTSKGDPLAGEEVFYATTDATVTVPAEAVDGYITPEPQVIKVSGDGSTVVNFYYKLEHQKKTFNYEVEHYIKTSSDGQYTLFKEEKLRAEEGTIITPPLNQDAVKKVNSVAGCYCKEPALQTKTVAEGLVIKYYYDCVKDGTGSGSGSGSGSDSGSGSGNLTQAQIDEIAKRIAAGLSFSLKVNGVDYEIAQNEDGTLGIKFLSTNAEKVVIPDVVTIGDKVYRITEIYEKAFKDNTTIKEVELSANISKIGDSAFQNCTSLEKVTLHEGLVTIGNNAFDGCTSLTSIKTPSTLQTIGNYAFQNCTALKTVILNTGLVKIGNKAFYNCKALTQIKIPKTVLKIGSYAFGKCIKLKKVTFASESQLLSLGTGVFSNCTILPKITLPSKLANVPSKAFYNCKKLKTVKIGAAVTKIGTYAFYNCQKIASITIPSKVQTIGSKAFYNCKALKKVTIKSKAITAVGSKAFKKCKKGIKFVVPKSKKSAYQKLFKGKY